MLRLLSLILISIHAPLRERLVEVMALASPLPFQSTLPYGSDESVLVNGIETLISIHAPLRERHDEIPGIDADVLISIHAPLRERLPCYGASYIQAQFQSTLPYGSDPYGQSFSSVGEHFNPRSLTGATCLRPASQGHGHISIHAPLRERPLLRARHSLISLFQSTLPYGSDLLVGHSYYFVAIISIHAPLRERHGLVDSLHTDRKISIHAPLRERQHSHRHK